MFIESASVFTHGRTIRALFLVPFAIDWKLGTRVQSIEGDVSLDTLHRKVPAFSLLLLDVFD